MSASQSSLVKFAPPQAAASHIHIVGEVCPVCEQPIPPDRLEEINKRIGVQEQERSAEITARLTEQFAREKAQALEQAQQEAAVALDQERQETSKKVSAARDESRQAAEASAQERFAAVERDNKDAQTALITRIEDAEAAKKCAEETSSTLQARLDQLKRDNDAAVEKMNQDATAREIEIRQAAGAAAEAAMQDRINGLEKARVDAEAKTADIEQQVRTMRETQEADLSQRLQEQREALERDKTNAVNAEKSAAFEARMKLSTKVEELQRDLDKKTAEDLGEGAEIDLFEALKAEFEGDTIERVNKGQPGADILHTVIQNGKECGKIIYDSKNHNAWRNDFVIKLASDQMAAKAEHAILSTRKFPANTRHVHLQDGIVLASPSRVVALVQIFRKHLVQTHTLRLSNEERTQKTAALYDFITSERCTDLFSRIDTHADDLLDIQVKEKKSHDATWKRQGELIRSVQKVRAELCNEIDTIIEIGKASEQIQ